MLMSKKKMYKKWVKVKKFNKCKKVNKCTFKSVKELNFSLVGLKSMKEVEENINQDGNILFISFNCNVKVEGILMRGDSQNE